MHNRLYSQLICSIVCSIFIQFSALVVYFLFIYVLYTPHASQPRGNTAVRFKMAPGRFQK